VCGLQLVKLCDAIVTHGPYPICALYRCSLIHDKVLYKFRLLYFTLPHPLSLTVNLDILLTRRRLCNKMLYRCSLIHDKVLYKFRLLYFTLPHPLSLIVNLDILLTRRRLCNKIIKASQTVSAIEHWELVAGEGFFLLDVSFV